MPLTNPVTPAVLWTMLAGYIFTIGYSIYMAILNHKQAKVRDVLLETNKKLDKTNKLLKELIKNGKR